MSINLNWTPNWEEYENLVCDAFRHENPDITIERNVRVRGHLSDQLRQIDIALKGKFAGHDVFVVVDCKMYSRRLDVNNVGTFATMLDDVNADIGILVTQMGYTEAAINLARRSRIKLDIKTVEELLTYKIILDDYCEECDPGDEHPPAILEWFGNGDITGDVDKVSAIGYCNWCRSLHLRCSKCKQVTGIPEALYGSPVECMGGCGTSFTVHEVYTGQDGIFDYILSVQEN